MQSMDTSTNDTLTERVIAGGYCVGCGACASTQKPQFQMMFSKMGTYLPLRKASSRDTDGKVTPAETICPFSDSARNETEIANELFSVAPQFDRRIGRYREIYVGAANSDGFREKGSSGGLTNWILNKLLETGQVDAVVGVGERREEGDPLFTYQVARSAQEISRFSKSKYYPVELSKVIAEIRATPGRYAIVVVPCFAKAIRNLCAQDELLASRITYVIAIVCGHLKSTGFAESLAWQVGVAPDSLKAIDFRVKVKGQPANRYAIRAEGSANGRPIAETQQVFDLYGSDWGLGYFKLQACDYCDDIAGETADMTLGDAWLPEEIKDWRGTNILIVRNPTLESLLIEEASKNEITLRKSNKEEFVKSQDANFRHRHDGMAYRLHCKDMAGEWRPSKRIKASDKQITRKRQRMMDARTSLAAKSHIAFHEAKTKHSFSTFKRQMRIDVLKYYFQAGSLTKYAIKSAVILLRKMTK